MHTKHSTNTQLHPIALPQEGFARQPAVLAVSGMAASTMWAQIKEGRFPAPVKLGPRITAWRVEDIRAWIRSRGQ